MSLEAAALAAALLAAPCSDPRVPAEFDIYIEAAVERYWPEHAKPFKCWWKAQLWSESRLDPSATSPAKARGIAQVMPATFAEEARRLGITCSPWDAQCSIEVGTAFSAKMMRIFTSPRPVFDLLCWEAVAYNAGPRNGLKSQVISKSENCDDGLAVLDQVTGKHAKETRGYVARIRRWMIILLKGGMVA